MGKVITNPDDVMLKKRPSTASDEMEWLTPRPITKEEAEAFQKPKRGLPKVRPFIALEKHKGLGIVVGVKGEF